MRQQQMVRELVNFSVNAALQDRDSLRQVFEQGFPGFLNMPKHRLIQELQFRGILDYEDEETIELDETEDDKELMVMLSGLTTAEYFD
jgi:hypothetical protein